MKLLRKYAALLLFAFAILPIGNAPLVVITGCPVIILAATADLQPPVIIGLVAELIAQTDAGIEGAESWRVSRQL